jgi:hypothetical protein
VQRLQIEPLSPKVVALDQALDVETICREPFDIGRRVD